MSGELATICVKLLSLSTFELDGVLLDIILVRRHLHCCAHLLLVEWHLCVGGRDVVPHLLLGIRVEELNLAGGFTTAESLVGKSAHDGGADEDCGNAVHYQGLSRFGWVTKGNECANHHLKVGLHEEADEDVAHGDLALVALGNIAQVEHALEQSDEKPGEDDDESGAPDEEHVADDVVAVAHVVELRAVSR